MEAKAKDSAERRERLNRLLDDLHEGELDTVETFVEFVHEHGDALTRALKNAPEAEEPLSDEDREALEEGRRALEEGDVVTDEELRETLGI